MAVSTPKTRTVLSFMPSTKGSPLRRKILLLSRRVKNNRRDYHAIQALTDMGYKIESLVKRVRCFQKREKEDWKKRIELKYGLKM